MTTRTAPPRRLRREYPTKGHALVGVYVTLFFLVAQLINWLGFGLQPALPIMAGGSLIVAGGLMIAFWPA